MGSCVIVSEWKGKAHKYNRYHQEGRKNGMNNRKMRIMSGIFFLCLFLMCGCAKEESVRYIVRRINSTEQGDDYYLNLSREIWQYSVSRQEVTNIYGNGGHLDWYAADDDFLFFVVKAKSVDLKDELWKVDRRTGAYDLFMKGKNITSLAIYDGFLFYGTYGIHDDVYVCPTDGNPEEDSISLFEQFKDDDSREWWKEVVFRGWRIQQYNNRIVSVIDDESGEKIYSNFSGYSSGIKPTALWMGGEWLLFTHSSGYSDFEYQRTNEGERHKIECLADKRYHYSNIEIFHMVMENQKVIVLLTVSKRDMTGTDLQQKKIRNDLLFEIDLETDTSRIIYSTKNNRTRIIGYKEGKVYLLRDGTIYREEMEGAGSEEVMDLQEEGWELYEQDIYFDWHGDNLIIWGTQEGKVRIESLEV